MGRLFWKFFFVFWLALLIAGLTVGSTVWLRQLSYIHQHKDEINFEATNFLMIAADIHRLGGDQALLSYISGIQDTTFPDIYAVDEKGHDILNRPLSAEVIQAAHEMIDKYPVSGPVMSINATGKSYLLFALQLKAPQTTTAYLHLPYILQRSHPVSDSQLPLSSLILIGFCVSILFSYILAWYFTKPIKNLREGFTKVANGQLGTRVGDKMGQRDDELSELGASFDMMAKKVQNLFTSQQRLLHDVSHELRSPLARMQAAIGVAQQQPEKAESILLRLEKESQRISDLVGELLLLSKLESSASERDIEKINLCALVKNIVEDAKFEVSDKTVNIKCHPKGVIYTYCQPTLMQRAIENVVRNAIKYVDDETGTVNIYSDRDTSLHEFYIYVDDNGPGVAESELHNIFKPFHKGGQKRIKDSVGLGLAIASRAMAFHGGRIMARNRESGGLQVILVLPLAIIEDA